MGAYRGTFSYHTCRGQGCKLIGMCIFYAKIKEKETLVSYLVIRKGENYGIGEKGKGRSDTYYGSCDDA